MTGLAQGNSRTTQRPGPLRGPGVSARDAARAASRGTRTQGSLEITIFVPRVNCKPGSETPATAARGPSLLLSRSSVGVLAAIASVCLHVLLIGSMIQGFSGKRDKAPDSLGTVRGTVAATEEEGALQWIDVGEESSSKSSDDDPATLPKVSWEPDKVVPTRLPVPHIELPTAPDKSRPAASVSEQPGDSRLSGLYVGQINARIERAWLRPRTPIGAPTFVCRVRIDQAPTGAVEQVTLEQCNGSDRWQVSLVHAIETASPLPAPPDPSVFARILHLSFRGDAYNEGSPHDLYEPETSAAITANDQEQAVPAQDRFGRSLYRGTGRVVDLRIIGRHPAPTQRLQPPSPVLDPVGRAPDPSTQPREEP